LIKGLHSQGLPNRSAGFWNNVSVCCGNAGIAAVLLDRRDSTTLDRELATKLIDDLLSRGTHLDLDGQRVGLKWIQAEHRVQPELLQAQTGLMQGAAGIGMVLLQIHADIHKRNRPRPIPALPF
jgi:hypothetical protein